MQEAGVVGRAGCASVSRILSLDLCQHCFCVRSFLPLSQYFDVVIVNANKPSWYKQSRPFRELDPSNNRYQWAKVQRFEPGKTYVEGNVLDFMRMTGWRGRQVLYMGDNLFSDWMSPRSNHG